MRAQINRKNYSFQDLPLKTENKKQLTARLYCKLYKNIFSDSGIVAQLPQESLIDWDSFLQENFGATKCDRRF